MRPEPPSSASAPPERHPWARLVAWLIDWCVIAAWAGVLAAIGVPLYQAGFLRALPMSAANVLSAVVLVVPVTMVFAALESGGRGATIGKRVMRLRVVSDQWTPTGYRRTLARNVLKIAVPWLVGHAAVYAIVRGPATSAIPGWLWGLTGAAYLLPVVWVVAVFVGSGRTPYDRITRTVVRRLPR